MYVVFNTADKLTTFIHINIAWRFYFKLNLSLLVSHNIYIVSVPHLRYLHVRYRVRKARHLHVHLRLVTYISGAYYIMLVTYISGTVYIRLNFNEHLSIAPFVDM